MTDEQTAPVEAQDDAQQDDAQPDHSTEAVAEIVVLGPLHDVSPALADVARHALAEVTPASSIGELLGARDVEDGVVNIEFATTLGGYIGWHWTVSIATLPDGEPNVLELELMPFDGALLAPAWVPWADRLADYRSLHPDGVPHGDADDDDEDADDDLDEDADHEDGDDFDDLDVDALDDGLDDDLDDDVLQEAVLDEDEAPADETPATETPDTEAPAAEAPAAVEHPAGAPPEA